MIHKLDFKDAESTPFSLVLMGRSRGRFGRVIWDINGLTLLLSYITMGSDESGCGERDGWMLAEIYVIPTRIEASS